MANQAEHSRRSFLKRVVEFAYGIVGLFVAIPAAVTALAPAATRRKFTWIAVAKLTDLPDGQTTRVVIADKNPQGWYTVPREKVIFVKRNGNRFTVFSSTCSHLGCNVNWYPAINEFICPCHGGVYNADGKNIAGPPPRPLTQLQNRIKNNALMVAVG